MQMEMDTVLESRAIFARIQEQGMSPIIPIAMMVQQPFTLAQQKSAIPLMTIAMA
jgi:hypothetical protein